MKCPAHLARVARLPCSIFGCTAPANVHHIRHPAITGAGQRASDWLSIPLCHEHHQGGQGFHGLGRNVWERIHGSQFQFLTSTLHTLYADPRNAD